MESYCNSIETLIAVISSYAFCSGFEPQIQHHKLGQATAVHLYTLRPKVLNGSVSTQRTNPSRERAVLGTANSGTTIEMGTMKIILKLVILAKEGISIDILRETPPDKVDLPLEPFYEKEVDKSTVQSERDRKIRNEHHKNVWFNNLKNTWLKNAWLQKNMTLEILLQKGRLTYLP